MIKRTLVGYDGSESAQRALRFALDLMRLTGGQVHVVSVIQVSEAGPEAGALMMSDPGPEHKAHLEQELASFAPEDADLFDAGVIYGSPGDVLLQCVENHAVDHIVLGHTERGALLRWLMGSVSSDILARAHVPVTVIR